MTDFIWNGRYDGDDRDNLRLFQVVNTVPLEHVQHHHKFHIHHTPNPYAIVGFQSDEGVRRNQGRLGARDAPDTIRAALAHLPHSEPYTICDTGNVTCQGQNLEQAQQNLSTHVCTLIKKNHTPIILGGGHETSYGGLLGVHNALPKDTTLGIINFDAHFDLRHTVDNSPTSGTPFWDAHNTFMADGRDFHYFCMGIAQAGNTNTLFKRADALGVQYCYDTDCHMNSDDCIQKLLNFVASVDYVYMTIDMDAFNAGIAMGVSAVNPMGIHPAFVEQCMAKITAQSKIIALDVVEVNPQYDQNAITAKLASRLIHTFMKVNIVNQT